ncbi:MAG: methyltransferase [Candidatus Omnitrophota bacterium]|jgi:hypothetical protein|nr:MAG: methyltransferase [Candidatus Omnitrophota bacterium]
MKSRERVIRALDFTGPDRAPRDLWRLPGMDWYRADEVRDVTARFPLDIASPPFHYGKGDRERGEYSRVGEYSDEWGCVWKVAQNGVIGEVVSPPLADWASLATFQPPFEVLNHADLTDVNRFCEQSGQFVLAGTNVKPFERMQALRGVQNLFLDFGYGARELDRLREMVHDYFCREIELWANTTVDGVCFLDDWGTQTSLLISPTLFREFFKPLYAEYAAILRRAQKRVFMHSDGFIEPILPDLIEIGVDALNSQLFCMNIENLANKYKGKITFWGELDRQHILPFGTINDVKKAVRRIRAALDDGAGGVIAQFEWGLDVPQENAIAAYEAWMES